MQTATAAISLAIAWGTIFGAQFSDPAAPSAPIPAQSARVPALADRIPEKPSLTPSLTIPVAPMGFSPPGALYLCQRNSLVSLDFLDENRLLFTFRVPGLLHRDTDFDEVERQIRAVVVALPSGHVESEALWTVHDRSRYLWMLKDGHFLFRDRSELKLGDATLEIKPYLRFPAPS